ncbi:aminotransferase class I/II-fold pyridoxal phosphate-dependent enzyme [Caldibacillus lycopersici]|uniref:Aminotransferase n=1 Tax=Perspicuibacillus lycopersici TaxID=1325689 RepID=A0AAE3LPR8_9BACI|nr:aminotransferase class I/II-fold pyridoxal phosphate-dependent enzyme [Perspicuibacillus lycopersici]MCU9612594.1 aminotransferase class I/II-fold pyridoxal phosphate-dependent enzyme [Perspicuibacillus lycopersici]
MNHLLNPEVQSIQISGIRQITDQFKKYPDVLSLTIGEPDFKTPKIVKEAGKSAIDDNLSFYAPNAGILQLKKAATDFVNQHYRLNYNEEDEIIVTNGSTEGIFIALKTILNKGDEVIIPTPTYPGYEPVITLCGAKLVPIDVTGSDFKLKKEQLLNSITEKTKLLILPYPSNPTGVSLTEEDVKELVSVLKDKDIFVLSDELYSEITFEGKHVSIASYQEMREKTIVINGLSKSHAMTGWRVGFVFAPAYLIKEMVKVHQYVIVSVNSIAQYAGIDALQKGMSDVSYMRDEYQRRRDFLYNGLTKLGFQVVKPTSTFYMFPEISAFSNDSYEFTMDLLKNARVGVLPSTVFTHGGNKHLRISFASPIEKLEEALTRMQKYLGK